MTSETATEVDKGTGKTKDRRKFTAADWKLIAEYIEQTLEDRKKRRKDREKVWREVDRQISMRPDNTHKMIAGQGGVPSAKVDPLRAWMPEIELPWQATALEILTSDARRMMFPDSGPWYEAHAEMSDELLAALEGDALTMAGDEMEWPSAIDQDNLNKLVVGIGTHWKRQYDFDATYDATNAEAFKYGVGVARWRLAKKSVLSATSRGVVEENQLIPVRVPRSIKNTYLDDSPHELMNEGLLLGPLVIFEKRMRVEDIIIAAKEGSDSPDNPDGGWISGHVKGLEGDDHGDVEVIEAEGDIPVSRKTKGSLVLRGCIVTIVVGSKGKDRDARVVRFRWRPTKESSYEITPYHVDDIDNAYASGILMKASMVQLAAVASQNSLIEVGALQAQPPVSFDRSDQTFAQEGGPNVEPGAQWATNGEVKTHEIGNLPAALQVFAGYAQQYADLTGMNAARLGAQTVSHTTAYAKDAELSRGTVRTVDYVRSAIKGGMTRGLYLEWELGRQAFKRSTIYLDAYKGFVEIEKKGVPERAVFMAHGAAGPAEEQQKRQNRLQAAMGAIQLETLKVQLGGQPTLDIDALQEQLLKEGGWSDTEPFFRSDGAAQPAPGGPGVQGSAEQSPGTAIAALQSLRQGVA